VPGAEALPDSAQSSERLNLDPQIEWTLISISNGFDGLIRPERLRELAWKKSAAFCQLGTTNLNPALGGGFSSVLHKSL